jgi:Fe(3+) dicitrate transport protein
MTPRALAGQTAALAGVVRDRATGERLARVSVSVEGVGITALTNEDGRYRFPQLPVGEQVVRFSLMGYAAAYDTVRLAAGVDAALDVALVASPVSLRPVTVILDRTRLVGEPGRLRDIPGSAHYLDLEALEDPTFLYDDVHAILRQVPGVVVQEEEGYGLRPNIGLRGTGSERSSKITVMEDGVLIAPAPYAAPAAYYFPVVGRMEAIEVRKGSSQIKYGPQTIGGALNLVSSGIPDGLALLGALEAGVDATRKLRANVGDAYRHVGWLVETYQLRTDGYKRLDGGGDTGFDVQDYLVKLRVNADPGAPVYQELELKLGYTDELSHETYLGLTEEDFRRDPLRRYAASQRDLMDTEHRQLQARHFIRPLSWLDVTTTAYRNDFSRNWYKLDSVNGAGIGDVLEDPGAFPSELAVLRGADSDPGTLAVRANKRDYYAQGIQAHVGLRLGGAAEVELGVRYHEDEEDRFQHDDRYQMLNGSMVLTSRGAPGSQSNRVSDARAWAFFVQPRLTAGRLTVSPGVRFEHVDFTRTDYAAGDAARTEPTGVRENGVTAWIPGVGASYAASPAVTVFGGVHRGFGPPGPGAAPEAEPEQSVNYELGARVHATGLSAQAVGFFSDYENILGRATLAVGETGTGDLFNGGAVDVVGLELALDMDPLAAARRAVGLALPVRLAYTLTRATFQTSFESEFEPWGAVARGDRLPYLPEHTLYGSAGLRHRLWGASVSATYTGEMRTVAGQGPIPAGEGTDPALVVSLAAEWTPVARSTLFVAVQNVADERYVVARRPAGARPGLPRAVLAGVRLGR